jgi:hypothetical protein
MDRSTLIEKIAKHFGVDDSEKKLFFEVFLRKCSEALNQDQPVKMGEIGMVEFRRAQSEADEDLIVILTSEEEEFVFEIPEEEKESYSIDSYFSISIGKPVIPIRGESDSEFFIPRTSSELKRMFGLKIERFIEDAKKQDSQESALDFSEDISHVDFSFKNWKSSSYLDDVEQEEIKEEPFEEKNEEQIADDLEGEIQDEIPEEGEQIEEIPVETVEEQGELEKEKNEEIQEEPEVVDEKLETESKNMEPHEEKDIVEESEEEIINAAEDETVSDEKKVVSGEHLQIQSTSDSDEEKKDEEITEEENLIDEDTEAIQDAFKYAENKRTRLESYKKRSYSGFILVIVIMAVVGGIIYFSYYFSGSDNSPDVQQAETPREFTETVERSYQIPVTYPYEKGMLGEAHKAIDEDILNSSGQKTSEASSENGDVLPGTVEIRDPLPAIRIKGYIYKYENMFAVQVSSWKTRSIAISETQKFLNSGYDAFIEKTELSDKGTYYRVRIGSFSSLKEAEDFSKR